MAGTKKPRKKNNKMRRYTRSGVATVNGLKLVFVADGNKNCKVLNAKNESISIREEVIDILSRVPFQWSVLLAVFSRDKTGKNEIDDRYVEPETKMRREEISEFLYNMHNKMYDDADDLYKVGAGWIAAPRPFEMDDETLFEVFGRYGAWDDKSQYEKNLEAKEEENAVTS